MHRRLKACGDRWMNVTYWINDYAPMGLNGIIFINPALPANGQAGAPLVLENCKI